jgi:predicted phage terminase large subunit-like protein
VYVFQQDKTDPRWSYLALTSEITSRTNKQSRIASLEPYIKQGNLRFCRKHGLLLSQLTQFPLAKNDDGPDALEMAMQVAQKKVNAMIRIEF